MINKQEPRPSHKLFIMMIDKSKDPEINEQGRKIFFVKWSEVSEANVGSIQFPHKEILAIKYEPIRYEEDDTKKENPIDLFKNFFGGM